MENLIFCLNATIPVFLLMLLGLFFRSIGMFKENFVSVMNAFVFKVALPVLLFQELSTQDFGEVWDGRFVLFCFVVTVICVLLCAVCSLLLKNKEARGEFTQASFRSSAALLGISFIQNIYGDAGMAPMMIIGSVPLYNIMAVVLLECTRADRSAKDGRSRLVLIRQTCRGIVTNPIILGILAGLIWSACRIPQPVILAKTVRYVANLATPLGLMAMGASFHFKQAASMLKPTIAASFLKLVLFCALFLPAAVHFGYRDDSLIAILIMLGSPTTVSCFIMAKNMGHDGTLSSGVVMMTTLLSAFTLTGWLYLLKVLGLF
ncbi:MAG: AEC family transporter [Clostridium sp.]|nr:AEC family transporter [Clostridium sp.]